MKAQLIKLSEQHYIVVDDSVKPGDFVLTYPDREIVQVNQSTCILYDKKITHSTQPLEQYYGATDCSIPFVYHKIKPLSLPHVEQAIYGYSAEKMAELQWGNISRSGVLGYIDGFNAHKELTKDKVFTVAVMDGFVDYMYKNKTAHKYKDGHGDFQVFTDLMREYIQSIIPTQWDIEIDENGKITIL